MPNGQPQPQDHQPHYLLTALGIRAHETTYELAGRCETAPLTPLALLRLLPDDRRPGRVVAVVTEKAKQDTWSLFQEDLGRMSEIELEEPVEIPDGHTSDELREILHHVAARFPPECQLTIDVTQGLRHFPFVVYALALYLTSLRGVRLRGAYYGMLEGIGSDKPHPIIDLRPLLELPEWFHAVRVFRDQGIALPIAKLIEPAADRLRAEARKGSDDVTLHQQAGQLENAVKALEDQAFAYASGLPIELGKAGRAVADTVPKLPDSGRGRVLPLADTLADKLADAAQTTAFCYTPPRKGRWKEKVELDGRELDRQARLIDAYLQRRQVALAVGLMREWVISWTMWETGHTSDWLGYNHRKPLERRLGALGAFIGAGDADIEPTPQQREFGEFWNQLSDELRNAFMHHGMRPESMERPPRSLEQVTQFWNRLRHGKVNLPPLGGGKGRLLISPQGNRPGVLYSAIRAASDAGQSPDRCLVICSEHSSTTVDEAAQKAGYTGASECLILKDPFGGFDAIERLSTQARRWLLDSDVVLANLTGGTTLMGILVQRLVEQAGKLDRPVRRFALIDRRPPQEQDAEPYVQSEHHWLDGPPSRLS